MQSSGSSSDTAIDYSSTEETEEIDEVLQAIRDEEPDFIDENNALWFPPGAALVTLAGPIPHHKCYSHVQTMLVDEVEQVRQAVITLQSRPFPCDQRMTRQEARLWVNTLTQYPSYLLLTYGPNDKQDSIQQHRGHLVRDVVPPTCLSVSDRLNLADLASRHPQDRYHILNDAVLPAFPGDRPLIKLLINLAPKKEAHPDTLQGFKLPDTHCQDESNPMYHLHHTLKMKRNNWCIGIDTDDKIAARLQNRRQNQNLHLVFDLICAHLLTDPLFDNFDSPKPLKYDCISDFIPWSMIARYMDTGHFKQCIAPWFQASQIMHWSLYVKYNFFEPSTTKQYFKAYFDEGVCYTVYPWSVCPYAGSMEFYAATLTPRLIFQADLQVRTRRMYTWPECDFDEMPYVFCYPVILSKDRDALQMFFIDF